MCDEGELRTGDKTNEPYYWYVFYVRTGSENRVVQDIARFVAMRDFSPHRIEAFCPESEIYYRSSGKRQGEPYRRRPLFAGYVFVETDMAPRTFLTELGAYIYSSHDIIRMLKSGGSDNIALPDEERARLEYLLMGKRCVEKSEGYIKGDSVIITAGPLRGFEGLITYINRHNRCADIEVDMFGGKAKARVALEIVDKK